jgi:crotonobetainyl-CoA:carnitine CoA-transferase CaiB-like acyl-CoA transferase
MEGCAMRSMMEGVRVIDFTTTVAGPGSTFFLCDLGAEVIKVEKPGLGDEARLFPPYKGTQSASFTALNRGKKGITLDLKKEKAVAVFKSLVAASDVLVENFRPGVMARLGLGYNDLKAVNPRLIMCSISGYGQTGPLSSQPAYDAVIQAISGLMSTTGYPDGEPLRAGTLIVDISTAIYAALGISAALFARERTGQGEYLDVSMFDVAVQLLEGKFVDYTVTGNIPKRTGNRYPYVSPFDTFQASDGLVFIICAGDNTFKGLCEAIGRPELISDERFANFFVRNENEPTLKKIIEDWTRQFNTKIAVEKLRAHGVPAATVNNIQQVVEHPHTRARGLLVDIDQPGAGIITVFGPALKALNSLIQVRGPAPALGEHNRTVLSEIIGMSDAEIEETIASGAMG